MVNLYFETIAQVERLHRLFLDVLCVELDRIKVYDITNIQCLLLYNLGKSQLPVGDLAAKGYYLGSNISYNLKRLVQNGYISQEPSQHDKRVMLTKLTPQGLDLFKKVDKILTDHMKKLSEMEITEGQLSNLTELLQKIEVFWHKIVFSIRPK